MANNLKDHLKEVADAIRAKKGTSDLINPQDFATEIEGISGGGSGGESGGDNLIYINMEGYSNYTYPALASNLIKLKLDGVTQIISPLLYMSSNNVAPLAIAVNIDTIYYIEYENGVITEMRYEDIVSMYGSADVLSLPHLTKEQFYDLNA